MSNTSVAEPMHQPVTPVRGVGLASVFTLTIFLSALLLFSVQPMFTKIVLPLLGGSSSVWNTAMVFFQAMLLGGYIYAHLVTKYLPFKAQILTHLCVTAFGLVFLPLSISTGVVVPESDMPMLWLLGLFGLTVGAPFFALSANAPLLQRWFSLTDHADAQDPYFLYAASNLGSLLILCAYPLFIEPNLAVVQQTDAWAVGYGLLLLAILFAAWSAFSRLEPLANTTIGEAVEIKTDERTSLPLKTIAFWILLAFIPSSLMLGVTSYITNNIASAPFLWIVPLALYLLTFVIVFAKVPLLTSRHLSWMFPWIAVAAFAVMKASFLGQVVQIILSLTCFFLISLYCHSRLVETRPDVSHLTTFYILMSLGGVLGGIFNALVAPIVFVGVYEYAIVLFVAAFILPKGEHFEQTTPKNFAILAGALVLMPLVAMGLLRLGVAPVFAVISAGFVVYLAVMRFNLPTRFKLFVAATIVAGAIFQKLTNPTVLLMDRSFYSTLMVYEEETPLGTVNQFVHGNTVHNLQIREPGLETTPLAYYATGGSFELSLSALRKVKAELKVALVGLGAGALACHAMEGDDWTYFEIDAQVVEMARNPAYFSYLSECAPSADIRIGDARQRMTALPDASQDFIIVDAFSSNAIPAHLMTREAVAMYKSKLAPDGLIFFHVSNRMLDVASVAAVMAQDAGMDVRYIKAAGAQGEAYAEHAMKATAILAGPSETLARATSGNSSFKAFVPSQEVDVWTDDYASLVAALRAHRKGDAKITDLP